MPRRDEQRTQANKANRQGTREGERETLAKTERTRVSRLPRRAVYERRAIEAILDEALVCHLGFVSEGQPVVIPTTHARVGATLYIHGSAASRTLRALGSGIEATVAVTLIDGLVLARSAFHHSVNYRSVILFGRATPVESPEAKTEALRAFVERARRGRWSEVRPPAPKELKATTVLALEVSEASAKVREGPPIDDEEDYELPVWAGVVPLRLQTLPPIEDGGPR